MSVFSHATVYSCPSSVSLSLFLFVSLSLQRCRDTSSVLLSVSLCVHLSLLSVFIFDALTLTDKKLRDL